MLPYNAKYNFSQSNLNKKIIFLYDVIILCWLMYYYKGKDVNCNSIFAIHALENKLTINITFLYIKNIIKEEFYLN